MKIGGGFVSLFIMLMLLLSPPGVAESKRVFNSQQFTKQIRLELKVAQVTKHPVLTRGPLDYLAEGGRKQITDDNDAGFYLCKDMPPLTDEDELANIAKEVSSASVDQMEELNSKYYCYRFDILSYFIAKRQNSALKRALIGGINENFISVNNPNPYNVLYLFNQAVFAENEGAISILAENSGQYLYLALLNFIPQNDDKLVDWPNEIKKREHKYRNRKVGSNDLVQAVLHNSQYDLATVKKFIPENLRREEYVKALKSLIAIRTRSREE